MTPDPEVCVDRERDELGIGDLTYDEAGLIPAVVQQEGTGEVLMVAYMNAESLAKTVETGYTWFWSRSRQKYWQKGESSGHVQHVHEIRYDCDADCLLVTVDQVGPGACHTGERSCFYRVLEGSVRPAAGSASPSLGGVLDGLFGVLEQRKRDLPEGSYTTQLLSGPQDSLLKKIAEESGEVIMAAKDADRDHLRYEIGDLLYHLLVVMVREGLTLDDLAAELDGRRK
jgi:phosphoribosyl-ATP pyrophosphohydrolase/phosphoribosyl-AMP cyclohydrolase